jgi:four helix bundle protein
MERRNINRGFRKLNVWNDAIELYCLTCQLMAKLPYKLRKTIANSIDAAQSISRNIAEGYCRKSIKEYLQFLYFALGSCGELHSCIYSFFKSGQISDEEFDGLDRLHYKIENELIQLVKSLQKKQKDNSWNDNLNF